MTIITRTAVPEDLPTLYAFEQGIIEAERPFDTTLKDGHINYYDIRAMLSDDNTEVVVALVGEELIGSAYIRIETAKPYLKHTDYGYLGFMYVKPAYRGRGVNQQIMEALKDWARSRNMSELRLDVYDGNTAAIRAYEKAGFEKHLINMRMQIT